MTDTAHMRAALSQRRKSEIVKFEHEQLKFYAGFGFRPDGQLGEVFLDAAKSGTLLNTLCHDAAIAVSLALQYGCPAEELSRAFLKNKDGTPAGVLGHAMALDEAAVQEGGG